MYFVQVCNWFYQFLLIPVPISIYPGQVALITIFDIFMFFVYLGIFITLIKFIITGSLDFRVYNEDFHYSTKSNFGRVNREPLLDKQYKENHKYTKVTSEPKKFNRINSYVHFYRKQKIYKGKSMARNIIFGKKKKG